eukprot:TRINITY_DN12085_c0_g1_i1.p1 TRINITY_DN12085_c0_g1~~TRINITY_DN12085_c0_g1_i1.p1  ORF type:complete len:539 (-),score=82.23 TRINITY_DN12085_c0_g1_i1:709-2325(-)
MLGRVLSGLKAGNASLRRNVTSAIAPTQFIRSYSEGKRPRRPRVKFVSQLLNVGSKRGLKKADWVDMIAQRVPVIKPVQENPDPTVERWRSQIAAAKKASAVWEVYSEVRMDASRGDVELFNLVLGRAGFSQPDAVYKMIVTMLSRNINPNRQTLVYAFSILRKAKRNEDIILLHKLITHLKVDHIDESLTATAGALHYTAGPEAAVNFLMERMDSWPNGACLFISVTAVISVITRLDRNNPRQLEARLNLAERALRFFVENKKEGEPLHQYTEKLSTELVSHRPDVVWEYWSAYYPQESRIVSVRTLGALAIHAIQQRQDPASAIKMYFQIVDRNMEPSADLLRAALVALSFGRDTPAFEAFWSQYSGYENRVFNRRVYAIALEHYAINVTGEESLQKALQLHKNIPPHRHADTTWAALVSVYLAHGKLTDAMNIVNEHIKEPLTVRTWSRWIRLALMHNNAQLAFQLLDHAFGVVRFSDALYDELTQASKTLPNSKELIARLELDRKIASSDQSQMYDPEGDAPFDQLSVDGLENE